MNTKELVDYVTKMPKVELHVHIEGTLEPELMCSLAKKHNIILPYANINEIKAAYKFDDLQSFLDLYYQGANVLIEEDDFYQLMRSYLLKCVKQNIVHTEIMFDPQTHTQRGITYSVFMTGFQRAIDEIKTTYDISVYLILSFLRHLDESDAIKTLTDAKEYYSLIKAVGLDSSELGNPPDKFRHVFATAKSLGFKLVAHAGEEGPPQYIWDALKILNVDRIDHGVRCIEDSVLIKYLANEQIALTVCPLSNVKLQVVSKLSEHNLKTLMNLGLLVTVNSDDPSYFGGYLNDNYIGLIKELTMDRLDIDKLLINSFKASFLPDLEKNSWISTIANR